MQERRVSWPIGRSSRQTVGEEDWWWLKLEVTEEIVEMRWSKVQSME